MNPLEPNYNKNFREIFELQTTLNPRGQTLNPFEPRFTNQNQTTNPPKLSKNPELQTHELGLTQHLVVNSNNLDNFLNTYQVFGLCLTQVYTLFCIHLWYIMACIFHYYLNDMEVTFYIPKLTFL